MWAATSATVRTWPVQGQSLAVTGGPLFPTCQPSVPNRALSNRNTIPFKNVRNLMKRHAKHISNRNTNTTSAASRSRQPAGLLGGTNHDSQIKNPGISIHPVESSPSRVLASPFRRVMRATAPGGGAVMHVTSHISNSQGYFSAHEMPIWSEPEADFWADVCVKPPLASELPAVSRAAHCSSPSANLRQRRPLKAGRYKVENTLQTASSRLRSIFQFRFSNFRHCEVKNENLQY